MQRIYGYDHVIGPPCDDCLAAHRRCDHGRCSEIWWFQLLQIDVAAIELAVFTPFFPYVTPNDITGSWSVHNCSYHVAWPTRREDVLGSSTSCSLLPSCFPRAGGPQTDQLLKHIDQDAPIGRQPALWAALEENLLEAIPHFQRQREEDGDLRWLKCPHCDEDGLIDRRKL